MLRFGFLPSDFNPMILMLGEAGDLRALAGLLRDFARTPAETPLETLAFCVAANGTRLALLPGEGGLQAVPGDEREFAWRLDPPRARDYADRIEALAEPDRPAGSETLEEGAITVKVSLGEYTDDFLQA